MLINVKNIKILDIMSNLYDIINNRQIRDVSFMYVLAKSVLALMIGFIVSVIFGAFFVPYLRKKKAKQVAKLGKNPAQKQQNNRMKWFTYIMLALIIFMGFSLASAMGVYWFIGAVFSIIQTVVIQAITDRKAARK